MSNDHDPDSWPARAKRSDPFLVGMLVLMVLLIGAAAYYWTAHFTSSSIVNRELRAATEQVRSLREMVEAPQPK